MIGDFMLLSNLAPSAPRNLVAVPLNSTVIRITWDAPSIPNGLITNYEIRYSAVGSGDVISTVLSANQLLDLKALIDSLTPFTQYQIKIRAATEEGNIIWGNLSLTAVATTTEAGLWVTCNVLIYTNARSMTIGFA